MFVVFPLFPLYGEVDILSVCCHRQDPFVAYKHVSGRHVIMVDCRVLTKPL